MALTTHATQPHARRGANVDNAHIRRSVWYSRCTRAATNWRSQRGSGSGHRTLTPFAVPSDVLSASSKTTPPTSSVLGLAARRRGLELTTFGGAASLGFEKPPTPMDGPTAELRLFGRGSGAGGGDSGSGSVSSGHSGSGSGCTSGAGGSSSADSGSSGSSDTCARVGSSSGISTGGGSSARGSAGACTTSSSAGGSAGACITSSTTTGTGPTGSAVGGSGPLDCAGGATGTAAQLFGTLFGALPGGDEGLRGEAGKRNPEPRATAALAGLAPTGFLCSVAAARVADVITPNVLWTGSTLLPQSLNEKPPSRPPPCGGIAAPPRGIIAPPRDIVAPPRWFSTLVNC